MAYPQRLIRQRRRFPLDELLPDGSTVNEALQRVQPDKVVPIQRQLPVEEMPAGYNADMVERPPFQRTPQPLPLGPVGEPDASQLVRFARQPVIEQPIETAEQPPVLERFRRAPVLQEPSVVEPADNLLSFARLRRVTPDVETDTRPRTANVPDTPTAETPFARFSRDPSSLGSLTAEDYAEAPKTSEKDYIRRLPLDERIQYKEEQEVKPLNKWWRIGLGALGAVTGNPELVASAIDGKRIPLARRQQELGELYGQQARVFQRRKIESDLEDEAVNRDWKRVQTDEWRRRPEVEARRTERQTRVDAQSRIFRNLSLLKGQKLDPDSPRDAALLQDAADAGIYIDPVDWNNSASNEITFERIDPDNPTQTQRVSYNRVTGRASVLGQSGYRQPVDPKSGMTPAQIENQKIQREGLGIRREGLEVQKQGLGIRQDEAGLKDSDYENKRQAAIAHNATIDNQIPQLKREQAENERTAEDPNASLPTRRAARATADRIRLKIGELERSKKPVPAARAPRSTSSASRPKLTEQQVRDAAKAKNLDPEIAVKRARERGQL